MKWLFFALSKNMMALRRTVWPRFACANRVISETARTPFHFFFGAAFLAAAFGLDGEATFFGLGAFGFWWAPWPPSSPWKAPSWASWARRGRCASRRQQLQSRCACRPPPWRPLPSWPWLRPPSSWSASQPAPGASFQPFRRSSRAFRQSRAA